MAKAQSVTIADEIKDAYNAALELSDRFVHGTIQAHKRLPSDLRKKLIRQQSLFGFLSPYWRALTSSEKAVWTSAATYSNLTNWQLFVSDNAARIRNDLSLSVPPSDLWQVRAGRIVIESPASSIKIKQEHPVTYWVAQKISGTPWKDQLVEITESFSFPLDLTIRYKSDLTSTGPTQVARYYATVWTSYQGEDIYTDFAIDFSASTDWKEETLEISALRGIFIGYTLYIEISGYTGTLLFDNVRAEHSGQNWVRDPRCDDVNKEFTKAFAIVPPFWYPETLPTGSTFSSIYPPSLS